MKLNIESALNILALFWSTNFSILAVWNRPLVRMHLDYQMQAVVNLEGLADGSFLCAGAHGAGWHTMCFPRFDVDSSNWTADPLLPVVNVDAGQGIAGNSRVQERIRDVKHRPLHWRYLKIFANQSELRFINRCSHMLVLDKTCVE